MLHRFLSVPFLRAWVIAFLSEIAIILGLSCNGQAAAAANVSIVATPTIVIVFLVLFVIGIRRRWW
jgi:uncharacterized membrane protein YtjA (UPF0391 family)